MQAYICKRYGGPEVLELVEVPTPVPGDRDLLIRVHATTVSSGDARVRGLRFPKGFGPIGRLALGMRRPRQPILGTELSGTIESVGKSVTRFKPGDAVIAFPGAKMGCHAQYRIMAEDGPVALKPPDLSFEEAATLCFGGMTALHFIRKGNIERGESVLVIGASGAVGAAMVQLARHAGARVTAVTSTANLDLVSSLGAHHVIDYTKVDFLSQPDRYDVIVDTVAATSLKACAHILAPNGRLLAVAGGLADLLASRWFPMKDHKRVVAGPAEERATDVLRLAELAAAGTIRPLIDRRYGFARMPEAHAYVDTGRKRGSVVVTVASPATS